MAKYTVTLRPGSPADADVIAHIAVEAWKPIRRRQAEDLGSALFATIHHDWEVVKAAKVREACSPTYAGQLLVAEAESDLHDRSRGVEVVGFVTFGPFEWQTPAEDRAPVGEIWNNAVRPDFQGHGIGTKLYSAALERMTASGMKRAVVSVDPGNAAACAAYAKAGFVRASLSDVRMVCELPIDSRDSELD